MLGFGVVSRISFGFIADRIGGLATLLVGSVLQTLVLILYLGFSGLTSLYLVSALFGLVQGGIVPAYAIIVREYFPPGEAGARVGIVIMATLVGMAFGGRISGVIFDHTGWYLAAFAEWGGVERAQRRDRRLAADAGELHRQWTPRAGVSIK